MADLRDPSLSACAVRDALGLSPHPEGGHYREMWRDQPASGGRGVGTWSLVSCVVAPAFEFAGFEMTLPDWSPPAG